MSAFVQTNTGTQSNFLQFLHFWYFLHFHFSHFHFLHFLHFHFLHFSHFHLLHCHFLSILDILDILVNREIVWEREHTGSELRKNCVCVFVSRSLPSRASRSRFSAVSVGHVCEGFQTALGPLGKLHPPIYGSWSGWFSSVLTGVHERKKWCIFRPQRAPRRRGVHVRPQRGPRLPGRR